MAYSALQRYLLLECQSNRHGRLRHQNLVRFYDGAMHPPKKADQQNAVTKSLERLIDKGLMVGYGRRTPKKWFIEEVSLTPKGRKQAHKLLGEQQAFSFHTRQKS